MVKLLETKNKMGEEMQEALLMYAKAQWAAGDFAPKVRDSVKRATIRIDMTSENIAGVQLPNMNIKEFEDAESNIIQIGMEQGGQAIRRARERFREVLMNLVKIATLQTSFLTLDQVIKVTNRRVNALEHVVIPKFLKIMEYINQELEEMSREDYFRLKKVLDNKKRDLLADEKLKAIRMEEMDKKGIRIEDGGNVLLEEDENDEDIVV